jgi:hypothetical protein
MLAVASAKLSLDHLERPSLGATLLPFRAPNINRTLSALRLKLPSAIIVYLLPSPSLLFASSLLIAFVLIYLRALLLIDNYSAGFDFGLRSRQFCTCARVLVDGITDTCCKRMCLWIYLFLDSSTILKARSAFSLMMCLISRHFSLSC